MRESGFPSHGVGVLSGIDIEHPGRASTDDAMFEATLINAVSNATWKALPLPEPNFPDRKPKDEIVPSASSLLINETATLLTFIARNRNAPDEYHREWQCHGIAIGSHKFSAVDKGF